MLLVTLTENIQRYVCFLSDMTCFFSWDVKVSHVTMISFSYYLNCRILLGEIKSIVEAKKVKFDVFPTGGEKPKLVPSAVFARTQVTSGECGLELIHELLHVFDWLCRWIHTSHIFTEALRM